jgi:dihydroxyacetone kinase
MSTIYNDPAEFSDDATDGFVDLYSRYVRRVTGGVVRRARPATPKVAVVTGGGSGHYPAFCGVVGPGFADGAVIGNIFTSPSTAQAYSVGRAADSGAGVVFTYGNYAGDVMNFGLAGERLTDSGIPSRQVIVTDDIASAPPEEREKRRGIAGDVVVFKTMSAAAEEGADLDEVVRIGTRTNDATYTIGVAFDGCTFPGADHKHFTVPEGKMGLGLGIHGEPGQRDIDWLPAANLAALLVQRLLDERPPAAGPRVAVILNGLGATKYEELFVLWAAVARLLREAGLTLVGPEVGELVTSLDMAGVSLTLTWLDEELERLWLAPCDTPAFRRGSIGGTGAAEATRDEEITDEVIHDDTEPPVGGAASLACAAQVVSALEAMQQTLHEHEADLGRIDAVAGDGDHGRGMVRGVDYAVAAARDLARAGDAWAEYAGGTSGVLWGAALRAFGAHLGNESRPEAADFAQAADRFLESLTGLGKAEPGDKTLVDAVSPFVAELTRRLGDGEPTLDAWLGATAVAHDAAEATAALSPKRGRARPLAERSVGTPDPGAVSFVLCMRAVARALG